MIEHTKSRTDFYVEGIVQILDHDVTNISSQLIHLHSECQELNIAQWWPWW